MNTATATLENEEIVSCCDLHLSSWDSCLSFVPTAFRPRLHRIPSSNDTHEQLSVLRSSTAFQYHIIERSMATGIASLQGPQGKILVSDFDGAKSRKSSPVQKRHWFAGLILAGGIF
jgi:hypothetical protein